MQRFVTIWLACSVALLGACAGHYRPPESAESTAADEEDDDSRIDEEEGDEPQSEGDGVVDAAALRQAAEPFPLGEAIAVAGTGVTLRPPAGAEAMPFAAGFLDMSRRLQISVTVAEGGPEVLEAIRTGGNPQAPEPQQVREVTVAGQTGHIGHHRIRSQAASLESTWLLVHDGQRGMGVVATYETERAPAVRAGVQAMLESVDWDREAPIDPSAAIGVEVGPVAGLETAPRSTANLVLLEPGAPFPPEPEQPVVTVSALPMQVQGGAEQIQQACAQLAARMVPVRAADVVHEGEVEDGQLPGCERLATATTRGGERVATYIALLFDDGTPLLVSGSVDAEALEAWRPRFAAAARTVRPRQAPEAPAAE